MTLLSLILAASMAHASVNCNEQVNHHYGHYAPLIVAPEKVKVEKLYSFFRGYYQFDLYIDGRLYVSFARIPTTLAPTPLSFSPAKPANLSTYARIETIANRWTDLLAIAKETGNLVKIDIAQIRPFVSPFERCSIDSTSLKNVLTVSSESNNSGTDQIPGQRSVLSVAGDERIPSSRSPNGDR